jgi:hypothetical protein
MYKFKSAECPYTHNRRLSQLIVAMSLSSATLNCVIRFTASFKEDAFLTTLQYIWECAAYEILCYGFLQSGNVQPVAITHKT